MGKKRLNYVADFETTTDPEDCRVWGWGIVNAEKVQSINDVRIGGGMGSFIEVVQELSPAIVSFHNLKFDGPFIIDWLYRNGFELSRSGELRPGQFETLISNMGAWYSFTVCWENGKRTEFRDSLKKLPMPVARIAKAFDLPVAKGEIDYDAPRPVGHIPTPEEEHYIRLDVFIVAMALKLGLDQDMTKLTVGADSLAEYKGIIGAKVFERLFPILPDDMDYEIRQAYRGGFTYADERHLKKPTKPGITYDVNSLYPSVMYDRVLPFGEPIFVPGLPEVTEKHPLFIVSLTFTAKLKKKHIPCIQIKSSSQFSPTEYQKVIAEPVTLMCTNVDLALWEEHYDLDILSYNGGWKFKGKSGFFNSYIDKWMEIKANSTGGMRELAKLHLNSLYGKFATNPDVTGKYPVMEDNVVKLKLGEPETRDPVYTAMGVFITAYARDVTIRAAQENYDSFAYADTDSLHLIRDTEPDNLNIHPSNLGAWKREYAFSSALYIRAKQYLELKEDGEYEVHIAGLPRQIAQEVTFADVESTRTFHGKLVPRRVPGGIILEDTDFTLTV